MTLSLMSPGATSITSAPAAATPPLWTIQVRAVEGSDRRFWGKASSPGLDTENEIVDPAAFDQALDIFMALPVVDFFHTGIPIGLVTKAWIKDGELRIEGRIKPTPDCDVIWQGLQDGTLSELSIWGKRLAGTPECSLRPDQRSRAHPCVTRAIRMYTISLCPRGTAVNRGAWVEALDPEVPFEDLVRKAITSASALIHPTATGGRAQNKEKRNMPNLNRDNDTQGASPGFDQDEVPPIDCNKNEIRKTEEPLPGNEGGGEEMSEPGPTLRDVVSLLSQILERLPPAGSAGPGPAGEDLKTENEQLRTENEQLRKAIRPPREIVVDEEIVRRGGISRAKNSRIEHLFR